MRVQLTRACLMAGHSRWLPPVVGGEAKPKPHMCACDSVCMCAVCARAILLRAVAGVYSSVVSLFFAGCVEHPPGGAVCALVLLYISQQAIEGGAIWRACRACCACLGVVGVWRRSYDLFECYTQGIHPLCCKILHVYGCMCTHQGYTVDVCGCICGCVCCV